MIYDYIVGMLFYLVFILFLYIIGSSILKNDSEPYRFLVGYIVYSVLIGIGGIIVQILNTSWNVFLCYFILVFLMLLIFSFYRIKKENIKLFPRNFKEFLKSYWFLFCISLILVIISLSYQDWIWLNNCLDDGQYLNKMATLPYIDNPFIMSPPTGIVGPNSGFRLDVFTTGELENSVYMFLTQVTPSVFARVFMSGFNYFLLVNCIYVFAEKLVKSCNIDYKRYSIQYISCIVILFIFDWNFLGIKNIISVQDSWQFNTAMYFGSSIVRTMGIMFLITHFIDKEEIVVTDIILVVLISIMLMTHSSIALPVIFTTCMAYLFANYLLLEKRYKFIAIVLILLLFLIGIFLGNTDVISTLIYNHLSLNTDNLFMIITLLIVILSFMFKSRTILRCNLTLLIIAGLILIDPINNIFEKLSMYDFVAARNLTTLVYTLVITMSIYVFILLNKFSIYRKNVVVISMITCASLVFGALGTCQIYESGIIDSYKTIWKNKKIIPDSTVKLGEIMSELSKEKKKLLNVIMPETVIINGDPHSLAIIIRTFAPEIRSISAIGRFGTWETGEFSNYSAEEQKKFDEFLANPNDITASNLEKMLDRYPINCIVIPTNNDNMYIEKMGYESYDKFVDIDAGIGYNIYYKK